MPRKSIFEMNAAAVYDMLVQKAERKGRTRAEVEQITCWLTGYTARQLSAQLERGVDYGTLFREAPQINPKSKAVTGKVCGVRVEEIEDPLMRQIRCLDKMVDELSNGKAMEKILRSGDEPTTVDEYIAAQPEQIRPYLDMVRDTIRRALPDVKEMLSWGMPTYWKGCNLIHFAAQKNHIGLHPGEEAVAHFSGRLAGYEANKGTIRLLYSKPLPLELIAEIAVWCAESNT